uniref:Phosphoinositide-3-kinase, regulatory subunit 6a n=1 Tax=Sinocyclocheilus grahami TaxID=75366 RepID=A0A672QKK2_SINGR
DIFYRTQSELYSALCGCDQCEADVISMADSTITVGDIEGELCKIERIRDILIRRESELRYMMDDIQLCKEITRLKKELQKLLSIPGEIWESLLNILQEREEDKEMAEFLKSKLPKIAQPKSNGRRPPRAQQNSTPFVTKTGLTLLKECCGFTCSIM